MFTYFGYKHYWEETINTELAILLQYRIRTLYLRLKSTTLVSVEKTY